MGFLGELANQIDSQMSVGENTNHSLDAVVDGQQTKYGSLGDFAKQFDQSSERRYVEEGYLRRDPFNSEPKQFEILMQEPNATVLLKKRMFSSVNENYRPDYMDADEKLYYKAMKILFQNKCRQISALEKLSKIQKITSAVGNISDQLMPLIISLTDDAGSGFSTGGPDLFGGINSNGDISKFTKVVDRMRRLYAFNNTNNLTTWITDPTNLFQAQFGQGTGVIEITNFTNLSTNVTLDLNNPGSFSLSISDPYEAMLITEYDIERALSDATNSFYNRKVYQFGKESSEQLIAECSAKLNALRSARKVSPISVKVNPDTLLGRRVFAVLDRKGIEFPFKYDSGFGGLGSGVSVSREYLMNGEVAGIEGLSTTAQGNLGPDSNVKAAFPESELDVFKRLVSAIFSKLQLEANSQGAFQTTNKLTNYARRKLRFNFSGKLVIQPMDTVHMYINSKSRYDNKLLSGLPNMFTGSGILQNLNKTVTDLKNAMDTVFNPGGSVNFQIEKATFVGPDFPNYLWALIRNQFVMEKEGTHVFAGIVQGATSNWGDGRFGVDVRGTDNTAYFEMGKVNFKPGVDVFNGALFDPLTPFKTRFDTISSNAKDDSPELLHENKLLLGTSKDNRSPLVKYKLGPNAGLAAHEDNFLQDTAIEKATRSLSKVFYAPDGLVYKWKEGIGTYVQFGSSIDMNDPYKVGNPSITKEPFAGQDVMNVLSLLVTGTPYNFATYWKAASNFDGFQRDPQSQQDSAHSYYDSLRSDLSKNNITWGNFIPFKTLTVDEQSFANMMNTQFRIIQRNKDLESKLKKLAEAKKAVLMFSSTDAIALSQENKFEPQYLKAQSLASELETQVKDLVKAVQKDDKSFSALTQFSSDTSYDFNEFLDGGDPSKQMSDAAGRRLIRRQINYLTRRMSYNVRANEDKNLFIIDDFYDKDYDIAAYESSLADGIKLYNNEFTSVKEKISAASNLLNLEVFADTQGHIRVRPPQYNRMPGSIFYRMMYLKKSTGLQIFPQFLDDLFGDQIKSLRERVEIIEDQIRLDCAVLGIGTDVGESIASDGKCEQFINSNNPSTGEGAPFSFLSKTNGLITDLDAARSAANPDEHQPIDQNTPTFTTLQNQATTRKDVFTNTQKYQAVIDSLTKNKLNLAGYGIQDIPAYNTNARVDDLIQRIQTKSGQKISRTSYLQTSSILNNGPDIPAGRSIDVVKVLDELSSKIAERQKSLKLLYSSVKNAIEARTLDDDEDTSNDLLTPGVYHNMHVPEMFEHMIEDETYDDYGPGSGSRYIIKRAQIKNISISETTPDFTMVEVQGRFDPYIGSNNLPGELNSVFPGGGNALVTAAAVDYDMWRTYGFKQQSPVNVPFLSDPESQCAPYASMILSRARRNILRGTVTIAGNEYMQPGEVVFLQDRGMLFYVSSVKHDFKFGSSFTTTLELTYGHSPGEYIPTTLDVIGKLIYNNRDTASMVVQRQSSSLSDKNIGIVIRDKNSSSVLNNGDKDQTPTSFNAANTQTINNILYNVAYIINSNNTKGNTVKAKVELRVYADKNQRAPSNELSAFCEEVKKSLTMANEGPKQGFGQTTGTSKNVTLDPADVVVSLVDLDDPYDKRSPSQKAIDASRNYINISGGGSLSDMVSGIGDAVVGVGNALTGTDNSNTPPNQKDLIRNVLFQYIVDCWVKFEQVPVSEANAELGF